MPQIVEVLLPLAVDHAFTYYIDDYTKIIVGQLVKVPFRSKFMIGVVTNVSADMDISKFKMIEKLYNIWLDGKFLNFINKVANYNLIPSGMVLKMALSIPKAIEIFNEEESLGDSEPSELMHDKTHLTEEQDVASSALKVKLIAGHNVCLLDGVTGSGKTEVYLSVIEKIVESGGQALVLLPEILLTSQLVERFKQRFKVAHPVEWHSNLSLKVKRQNWQQVAKGKANFVVGARSALFLPYKNLKMIVVDEEHDSSYKQEEGQIYNARDMAILRAKEENILAVLSSATPSIETMYNVEIGKYSSIKLHNRYGEAKIPEIILVDINKSKMNSGEWLSPELRKLMLDNYSLKKQTLLFLNRRGYAPVTFCKECKHKIECPNCNFSLVEHRNKKILQCHYCGYQTDLLTQCPYCNSKDKMTAIGPGVERLEEEVKTFLPTARISIITSDTIQNHKKVIQILEEIINNKVDVIIGSQMVTKGLHFPSLELVGVVDAESNIFGGDIRALERTYQVLHQVAGRAGRQSLEGKVVIQTFDPQSVHLQNLKSWNRQGFIDAELQDRKAANMPPFSRIIIITISSFSEEKNMSFCSQLASQVPELKEVRFLGPSSAPIFMLRKRYRHRFVIIAPKNINIQEIIKKWLGAVKKPASIKVKVDVDPYNFF